MNIRLGILLASAAAAPAFCSEFETLHVTVPFAFVAGTRTLPAGDYVVTETGSHTVFIRGAGGRAIVLGSAGDEAPSDRSALGFMRTAKGVYLKSVRTAGRPISVMRLASDQEK